MELPDGVEVFPGHVAGSLCGKGMSSKASSTIGFERRFNAPCSSRTRSRFVAESRGSTPKPPNIGRLVELNRGPLVGAAGVAELPVPRATAGLDVRPVDDFLAGHLHGAINVPVSGTSFATKAGSSSASRTGSSQRRRNRAKRRCHGAPLDRFPRPRGLRPRRRAGADGRGTASTSSTGCWRGVEVIDVRERDERDGGYIAGSRNIPYRLLAVTGDDLPKDRPVVTICETGPGCDRRLPPGGEGLDARPVLDGGSRAGPSAAARRRVPPLRRLAQLSAAREPRLADEAGRADRAVERERPLELGVGLGAAPSAIRRFRRRAAGRGPRRAAADRRVVSAARVSPRADSAPPPPWSDGRWPRR